MQKSKGSDTTGNMVCGVRCVVGMKQFVEWSDEIMLCLHSFLHPFDGTQTPHHILRTIPWGIQGLNEKGCTMRSRCLCEDDHSAIADGCVQFSLFLILVCPRLPAIPVKVLNHPWAHFGYTRKTWDSLATDRDDCLPIGHDTVEYKWSIHFTSLEAISQLVSRFRWEQLGLSHQYEYMHYLEKHQLHF